MVRQCPHCGVVLASESRFCPNCGAQSPRSAALSERLQKLASLLQRWGVPGFRSGVRWKQGIAAIGYALIALIILSGIAAPDGWIVAVGLLALVWVFLATNAWGLRQRVPVFGSQDKRVVVAGWIGLTAVSLLALIAAGQAGTEHQEQAPPSQAAAPAPPSAEASTSPTVVVSPSKTPPVSALVAPTQEVVAPSGSSPPPRTITPTPAPRVTPSPTPDDRPARLYELVVGAYRGTSKEFLVDGLTPESFKFDGRRVTVQTDWYPDDEAKEWAVGFCNAVAGFRSEFGYTDVQIKGQRDRTLARSENRGRDRQGNPIIVCRKA